MRNVLISYSSERQEVANEILHLLESHGISCWIAPRDIHQQGYATAIVRAIKRCKVLVLVLSVPAAESIHVNDEVAYAKEQGKIIVPYVIDNIQLDNYPELHFRLIAVHQIFSRDNYRAGFDNLVTHVKSELERITPNTPPPSIERITPNTPPPATTTNNNTPPGRYNVGDFYRHRNIRGIVFEVSGDCCHGKILSLVEATRSDWDSAKNSCNRMGSGWHLPTIDDLKNIQSNKDLLNDKLGRNNGARLQNVSYWTSDESDTENAVTIEMQRGNAISSFKGSRARVRAIKDF